MKHKPTRKPKYEAECISPYAVLIHTENTFLIIPLLFAVAIEKEQLRGLSEEERNSVLLDVIDAVCNIETGSDTQKIGEA